MSTLEYIQLRDRLLMKLLKTKDVSLLEKIEELFNNKEDDVFNELPKHLHDKFNKSLEESKNGEVIPFDEVMKEIF